MAKIERTITVVEFEDGEFMLLKDLHPQILTHMWIGDDIESAFCMKGSDAARLLAKTLRSNIPMDELIPGDFPVDVTNG